MVSNSFFFDTMSLLFKQGSTTLTVAVLQNVEIKPGMEFVELYGADSIVREDVAQRKLKVEVSVKTAKFHPNLLGYWMGTQNAGKDIDGGTQALRTQGLMNDTNTPVLFTLTGTLTGKSGETFLARATNVYFENMNFGGSAGEYCMLDLKGIGDNFLIEFTTT